MTKKKIIHDVNLRRGSQSTNRFFFI